MKKAFVFIVFIVFTTGIFLIETSAQKKTKGKSVAPKKYQWSGEWNSASRYAPSTLTIKTISASKFEFAIEAMNGANTGEISGIAKISGGKAYFDDRESDSENDSEKYGCRLTFINRVNSILVEENQECNYYAGSGVVFGKIYQKGKPTPKEQNFVQREVFPNHNLDKKFKMLVGKDYERFLEAFHQIYDEEDLDGLNAKVFSACVRGICPWNAGIIMFDAKGNIWAAVIAIDDADKTFVHYYTNASGWMEKLPKTIENWVKSKREMSENLSVIFKNKK